MEGLWKTFYLDSQLRTVEFYKDGKKEGTWRYYDEKGKLIQEQHYRSDTLVGN